MGAFRRDERDEAVASSPYPVTKSDVVPALRGHGLPRLWDDEEDDHEITGPTGAIPPSVRTKTNPHLTIMTGLGAGQAFSLGGRPRHVIGRSRSSDLQLVEEGVSRHHCVLTRRNNSVFVEDARSTNGTLINGARVRGTVELRPGDRLQLGPKLILQFGMFDETEESLARRLFDGLTRDALTQTFNRRIFDERLAVEVAHAQRHKMPLCVLLVDIDDLKSVNAAHGREAGDEMLKAAARTVGGTVRTSDVFCRYGGTKFAFLVRDTLANATRLVDSIRSRVAGVRVAAGGRSLSVTVSIGIAENGERGAQLSGEGLVRVAEKRLERAKALGRGHVAEETGAETSEQATSG